MKLRAAIPSTRHSGSSFFVERVVALRDGTDPAREDSRDEDAAAVQRLAQRKIFTPEIQAHLEDLLEQAKQLAPLPEEASASESEIQRAADALHVWLSDWVSQARAFITRGDYLIRLGLSTPRSSDVEEEPDVEAIEGKEVTAG